MIGSFLNRIILLHTLMHLLYPTTAVVDAHAQQRSTPIVQPLDKKVSFSF